MLLKKRDGEPFMLAKQLTTAHFVALFAHNAINLDGQVVGVGEDIELLPDDRETKINKIFQFFRKNELKPEPCSYYEEDDFLLGCLWQMAEKLVEELKD